MYTSSPKFPSQDLLERNAKYAKEEHKTPPMTKDFFGLEMEGTAILTCMDARVDLKAALGLATGNAPMIRNGGSSARDAINNILILQQFLGFKKLAIIKHTDCGTTHFTPASIRESLVRDFPEPENKKAIQNDTELKFRAFGDPEESVKDECRFLRGHVLVRKDMVITGWVYDTQAGKIRQVDVE